MREGPWGQAAPTRSLNRKPCHLGKIRFSNPKARPDKCSALTRVDQQMDECPSISTMPGFIDPSVRR